jgi:hypothetical protein
MKKLLGIMVLGLMLQGCDRVSDKVKEFCGVEEDVLNAKTDQAAKYAFEACVIESKSWKKEYQ